MIRTQMSRVLWFCFSIIIFCNDVVSASLLEGTLVATAHGLVPIQKLKIGDKVLGYDLNEPNYSEALCEVSVTKIDKHMTDSLFTMCTEDGWVEASPHQLLFTLLPGTDQKSNARVMDFVQAQDITEDYMLIDTHMKCLPIFETNRMNLTCSYPEQYAEKVKCDRHKRVTSITRQKITVNVYALEVEEPHVFLIAEYSYAKDMSKTRLLLTHNGIPALLPLTYQVASSSALSFPSILGGISVVGGPVVLALGITGLGYFGYQLFKSHGNSKQPSFYIERAGTNSPGGMDPKEPNDPIDAKKNNFAPGALQKHFDKHVTKKAEWGTENKPTVDQYLSKARNLLNSPEDENIVGFVSKDGWKFRYNKATNEFATAKPDGTIETLFRPEEGIKYWEAQIAKYKL